MIDFHCHLDLYDDPASVVAECGKLGAHVLSVTTTPSAWIGTSSLAGKNTRIMTALGLHPEIAHERLNELVLFESYIDTARYIGEIGLDGVTNNGAYWREQVKAFSSILRCCKAVGGRPLSIHSRSAVDEVLSILGRHSHEANIPILHWFTGSDDELKRAISMDCWFSVGPAMLKSLSGKRRVALMPRHRVVPETDGPFAHIGRRHLMPWDVVLVVDSLSEIWRMQKDEVRAVIKANFNELTGMSCK